MKRPKEYSVKIDRTPATEERSEPQIMRPRGRYTDPGVAGNLRNRPDVKTPENPEYSDVGRRRPGRETVSRSGGGNRRHHHRHRHRYGCGHHGYGYHGYDPFYGYSPYYYGYSSYYGAPYLGVRTYYRGHDYGSGGGRSRYSDDGALGGLDVDIRPDKTEIYIDGEYVGVADQYDGFPTYLWLEEGTYEIAFFYEGYETIFRQYTIYPGVIIDIDDRMREGHSIRPEAPVLEVPAGAESGLPTGPPEDWSVGRIIITASPADAAVYLDGHFVGTAQEVSELTSGLLVEPGEHVVEIVRPGFGTESAPVSIEAGGRVDLRLGLDKP